MKKCPECELLNDDDVDTCKHCGAAFFSTLECLRPRLDDPADDLVVVGEYPGVIEASLSLGILEGHGISACIPEELTPQIFWSLGPNPIEGVTVRVAARDLDAARRILAEVESEQS
jgi:hypothetical protein